MAKAKTAFTIDTKDFDIKFAGITGKKIPASAARAATIVAAMVIRDAVLREPKVPHKTGHLKGTQIIERPKIISGEISIELGFDAEYAAAVHEMVGAIDWSEPGSGPKFLESKLSQFKEKYMGRWADEMKKDAK